MANLQYIKAKGSYGIHYGLGLDEIAVNFEHISGLINLAGANGTSKTTFMEMLSPFPVFPSRQQKNPQKYNFKKQFKDRNSYKEVCYLHQSKTYVFRVEIPAGTTMSPEGFITCDGVPMVKGKISEYKRVVSELFGSEKLFYSSIFSCQGGQKLTDLTVGDFKNLLIELLGLKKYTEYWHNTGAVIKECESALAEVLRDLEFYSEKETEIEKNGKSLELNHFSLEQRQIEISGIEKNIAEAKVKISVLQKELSESERQEAVVQEKQKQFNALTDQIVTQRAETAEMVRKWGEYRQSYYTETKPYSDLIKQKDEILNASSGLESAKAEVEKLNAELASLTEQGTDKKNRIGSIEVAISKLESDRVLNQNNPEIKILRDQMARVKTDIIRVKDKIILSESKTSVLVLAPAIKVLDKELEQFAQAETLLTKRPGLCTIDECPFIKDALEKISGKAGKQKEITASRELTEKLIADEKLVLEKLSEESSLLSKELLSIQTDLEKQTEEVQAWDKDIKARIDWHTTEKTRLSTEKDTLTLLYKDVSGKLTSCLSQIALFEAFAGKKADLETAEKLLDQADRTFAQKTADYNLADKEIHVRMMELEEAAESMKNEIILILPARTSEEIKTLLNTGNYVLPDLEGKLKQAQKEAGDIEKSIAVLEDKTKAAEKNIEEIAQLKSRETFVREELSKWSYIRDAVSKSGLQALEISAAAPLLTGIANDLLHSAYGGEFFLDLVTQDPETGAEILDIMITRGDGQTYSLCDFSGGESVWILQAFKAAQILVNTEKSGIHFATCFADEESGALDKEKAERFIQMYRALMVQGHFEKLFFISHIPECQTMADHSLIFQQGGIVSESDIGMVE